MVTQVRELHRLYMTEVILEFLYLFRTDAQRATVAGIPPVERVLGEFAKRAKAKRAALRKALRERALVPGPKVLSGATIQGGHCPLTG